MKSKSNFAVQKTNKPIWTLYGPGSMGAKAGKLFERQEVIERAGFSPWNRTVFCMGLFEGIRKRNNADRKIVSADDALFVRDLMLRRPFVLEELEFFREIFNSIPKNVLYLLRSSAHGDSRGTGFYESTFFVKTENTEESFARFIRKIKFVLASEFSKRAWLYRQKKDLDPGVAIILEQAVARDVAVPCSVPEGRYFASDVSGFAYSSTDIDPDGYANLVVGLPTKAVKGQGLVFPGYIDDILSFVPINTGAVTDWMKIEKSAHVFDLDSMEIVNLHLDGGVQHNIKTSELFSKIRLLEELTGQRQYIELAVIAGKELGESLFFVLQISDVVPSEESVILPKNPELVALESNSVLKAGSISCDRILFVGNSMNALNELKKINAEGKPFILVADYRHFSNCSDEMGRPIFLDPLDYSRFNNAVGLVVVGPYGARSSVQGHFNGQLSETGIVGMYCVGDLSGITGARKDFLAKIGRSYEPKVLFELPVKLIADSKEGKGILMHNP